jgi:hypothetical protein
MKVLRNKFHEEPKVGPAGGETGAAAGGDVRTEIEGGVDLDSEDTDSVP